MSTTRPAWIRRLQVLYVVTLGIWLAAVAYVAYAAIQIGDWSGMGTLAMFAPGLIYFTIASRRLDAVPEDVAKEKVRTLFRWQRITGIPALVGAILGFIPAAINIPMLLVLAPGDQLYNAGMLVPWAMVYVFTVTYLSAEAVRRGLKARALAEQAAAPPKPVPTDASPQAATDSTPTPAESGITASAAPAIGEVPKLPIAPNLFLVGGFVLAMFTIQVEMTAFQMARDGQLDDLGSPGMAFSFFQFVDLFLGNAAGLVILIFGIINWSRDTVRFRKIASPLLAAFALAVTPGTLGMAAAGFTGLSPEAQTRDANAQISSDWINNLMESGNPVGFTELSDIVDCYAENCADDPDSSVTFVRLGDHESHAVDMCASAVAFAFTNGATSWAIAPDYSPVVLESADDPAANAMCVTSLADYEQINHAYSIDSAVFRLIGDGEIPFTMDLIEIDMGTADVDPDAFNYRFTVWTTFVADELLPGQDQLSAGTHELNDLLTAVGQARLNNPNTDPNDGKLIRDALVTYPHDIEVTPLVDKDGKIRFLTVQTSDNPEPMCVSIAPWDENYEGLADPGTGYGVSSAESVKDLKSNPHFGAQAWGTCSE